MDIIETKIVLDWAKSKFENDRNHWDSNPEQFERSYNIYQEVMDKFDQQCEEWVRMKIPGGSSLLDD